METFDQLESEVGGYIRSWPTVFDTASGWTRTDENGRDHLDVFAGAGALDCGHNHPALVDAAVDHRGSGRILHGLDMASTTERRFLQRFDEIVLQHRGLSDRLQFPGPTGTNAVEATLASRRFEPI